MTCRLRAPIGGGVMGSPPHFPRGHAHRTSSSSEEREPHLEEMARLKHCTLAELPADMQRMRRAAQAQVGLGSRA